MTRNACDLNSMSCIILPYYYSCAMVTFASKHTDHCHLSGNMPFQNAINFHVSHFVCNAMAIFIIWTIQKS